MCLGREKGPHNCYHIESIRDWLKKGKTIDPATRKEIDLNVINTILGNVGNQLYRIEVSDIKSLIMNDDFNDDPNLVFDINNSELYDDEGETEEEEEGIGRIVFGKRFNQSLDDVVFPYSVDEFVFGDDFNQPIDNIDWPSNITMITFGKHFNQPIENVQWPDSIDFIHFGEDFNQSVARVQWPNELVNLTFGKHFNQPVRGMKCPKKLVLLAFGKDFNQSFNGMIFNRSLKKVYLPEEYSQVIEHSFFPSNVEIYQYDESEGRYYVA